MGVKIAPQYMILLSTLFRRPYNVKKLLAIFILVTLPFIFNNVSAETFVAGKDYTVINADAPKQNPVQVIEFFNYGCPWCAFIDPTVEKWIQHKPRNVEFKRVPLAFESGWGTYAKAYYLAKALKIENKITPLLFTAIHGSDNTQNNDLSSTAAITDFFVKQGVKQSAVENAMNSASPSMTLQLQEGPRMMKQYSITTMPTFMVGEKYRVGLDQAKTPERLMEIVDYLVKLDNK
ncbi:MAG: thiol:disulfide interchange protein DsbA/DsbL [Gammaproteobacteria bacterium]|nr:thiol:disulfide interchange protein DsbA/DsbL [Gammaproteobacteria bacterium]